jgi:hypothetical protein
MSRSQPSENIIDVKDTHLGQTRSQSLLDISTTVLCRDVYFRTLKPAFPNGSSNARFVCIDCGDEFEVSIGDNSRTCSSVDVREPGL